MTEKKKILTSCKKTNEKNKIVQKWTWIFSSLCRCI